jgi:diguanylate cyclase (GGDEF)-like protein/PAS domain S-box-containing protein
MSSKERRNDDLVAAMTSGLLVLGQDLSIVSMNRACREMFGLHAQDTPETQLNHFLPAPELRHKAMETLLTGVPQRNLELSLPGGAVAGKFRVSMARSGDVDASPCVLMILDNITELAALQTDASESLRRFEDLFHCSTDCILVMNENELIVDINPAAERGFGFSRDEVRGSPLSTIIHRAPSPLKSTGMPLEVEARTKLGGFFPAEWILRQVLSGPRKMFAANLRDLTLQRRVKLLEQDCLRVLEMVTNSKPLGSVLTQLATLIERQDPTLMCAVSVMRDGRLHHHSAPSLPAGFVKEITGLPMGPGTNTCGAAAYTRTPAIVSDIATDPMWAGRHHLALAYNLHASWSAPIFSGLGTVLGTVAMFRCEPGAPTPSQLDLMEMGSRLAAVAIEQWKLTNMLQQQAHYDSLTKLPNRSLFEESMERAVINARQKNQMMAVLYIDLDRFKLINDTLGHTLGDTLLSQATGRLRAALGQGAMLARMGGDEFAVILQDLRNPQAATEVASKLLNSLKRPFDLDGYELFVTASIGISVFPHDGCDVASLLRNADSAMYRAKDQGKNTLQCFKPEMSVRNRERLDIESYLHRALERDELSLYYQPQYEVESGRLVALESLLRWKHPKLGVVLPGRFIQAAEESGLIVPIGDWVLRQASAQNQLWRDSGHFPVTVGVNVSARQLEQPNFVDSMADVLAISGLDPRLLELELTETLILRDVDKFAPRLNQLRNLGVRIAIDDFGVGYSSLNYLQRLPFDTLKLDKSFMDEIKTGSSDSSLIESIVDMTHNLGMLVTAEGVETEAQLETLRRAGCDRVQGFLLSKPVTRESAEQLLRGGADMDRLSLAAAVGRDAEQGFAWRDFQAQW